MIFPPLFSHSFPQSFEFWLFLAINVSQQLFVTLEIRLSAGVV